MRCAIFRPKMVHCPPLNFFVTNRYYYFHLLIGPFHCAKFKKILLADPELLGCTIFRTNLPKLFFLKIIVQNNCAKFIPFIVLKSKKILPADPELWRCKSFGPKMAHFPKWDFFSEKLLISLVSFIHAYLHAKNRSQTSFYQWNIDDYRILKSHWPRAIFAEC